MPDIRAELDNDRIYQDLMHLHKQEHISDDCFCTTEVAGVYRNVLNEVTTHTNQILKNLISQSTEQTVVSLGVRETKRVVDVSVIEGLIKENE